MATYRQGILGPFSGRVGQVVGCVCTRRSNYMRSLPLCYHDAKTEAQLRNRAKMKSIMAFLSEAKGFVNYTLDGLLTKQTATNMATQWNFHKVSMEADGSGARPMYGELRLSKGERMPLDSGLLLHTEQGLLLTWRTMTTQHHGELTDKVHVLVYNETRHQSELRLDASTRGAGEYRLTLPTKWLEDQLHVYVAVSDREDTLFSDSQYCGHDGRRTFSMQQVVKKRFGTTQSAIKVLSECCSGRDGEGENKGVEASKKGLKTETETPKGEFGGLRRLKI